MELKIISVVKRDGRIAAFDAGKIAFAIFKSLRATGKPNRELATKYAGQVVNMLQKTVNRKTEPTDRKSVV